MSVWLSILLTALPSASPPAAAADDTSAAPDVAAICAPALRDALQPWIDYRTLQGRRVTVVPAGRSAADLKGDVQKLYAANANLVVLVVGDAEPTADADPAVRTRCVPTHFAEAKVNVVFGSEPQIATDNWYGDVDDDGVPEIPVGRLPVDSSQELLTITRRIIDYESSPDFGLWRRRINLIAGLGGFGPVADTALEAATKTLLTSHLPPAFDTTMTYASWRSPYFPGPTAFHETTLARYNEGCLLWVYIGHGRQREVDRLYTPDGARSILDVRHASLLQPQRRPPLALFLSCYSGAFDAPQDCLAEEMLRSEGGPIGVLCGSRVTLPYAMSIMAQELMASVFSNRVATIGEALRDAKRGLALNRRESEQDKQFDALAKALMPMAADLEAQRREHLSLFNLLGDPLLRLRQPEVVKLDVAAEARQGDVITVTGESPTSGRATIEFVVRRDRFTFRPVGREEFDTTPSGLNEMASTYMRANDTRLAASTMELSRGPFHFDVTVPAEAKGECHVRVYVEGTDRFALGSGDIKVRPASRTTTALRP
ncbi:MAG: hypothetical protein JNL96_14955 [Planctomycetaceae bacterium]|nr:hypothetical protein [Planctomycetaceae bacterium]